MLEQTVAVVGTALVPAPKPCHRQNIMRRRFAILRLVLAATALALPMGFSAPASAQAALGSFGQPLPPQPDVPVVVLAPSAAAAPPAPRQARKASPAAPPVAAVSRDPRPSFSPQSVQHTEAALARYEAIAAAGGWPTVRPDDEPAIARRLAIEGDLPDERATPAQLAAGIRRFQARHGLRETGIVAGPTLAAMNVPVATRVAQLRASLERMRLSDFAFGPRYVVVNIPSATVEAVEQGSVRSRHVAVVGKADRASPTVETRITNINFNPTWTVPASIIRKDIIPRMRRDPGYLTRNRIRILNGRGEEIEPSAIDWSTERAVNFTLRQDPGAGNSLGQVRIDMPNNLAVYMHDTPSKRLFARDDRFHSSGCVRVADVRGLVTWLLEENRGWTRRQVDAAMATNERRDVRLARAVPVAWTYFTGFGLADGTAHFRADIYDLDRRGGGTPIAMRPRPRAAEPLPEAVATTPEPRPEPTFWDLFRASPPP